MLIQVKFSENSHSFEADFGEVVKLPDESYNNGYNEGYDTGRTEGYSHGYDDGSTDGYNEGHRVGFEEGELVGFDDGYLHGEHETYSAFWNGFQENGKRSNYQYAFCSRGWTDDTFKPKYDIVLGLGYSGTNAFWECYVTDIAAALERQGVKLDTTLCGYWNYMFQNAKTKRLPALDCSHAMDYNAGNGLYYTFRNSQVETIDNMIVPVNLKYNNTFMECAKLQNIIFEGEIGEDINFKWSTLLTKDSITNIVNTLSTGVSGKTLTLSKTAVNNAFTTDEWNTFIATKPNWTITLA